MSDYDLFRLSTRSFEQLVQALAVKIVSPGITVFGDGPDGGREATFNGVVDFPCVNDPWSGYGVIQAKFLQETRGAYKDGQWAVAELEKELNNWLSSGRKAEAPDYFIYATNVTLTPPQDAGSKDKANEVLKSYASRLGIRDWRIWDGDQVRVFLDGQEDIRTSYAAWVTSGDVLARALERMNDQSGCGFGDAIPSYLQKKFLAERFAKLGTIGFDSDRGIPLSRVFVDLPAVAESRRTSGFLNVSKIPRQGVVRRIVDGCDLYRSQESGAESSLSSGEENRIVLIGGPGQGKSTLTQFLAQLLRANILRDRDSLLPEARDAIFAQEEEQSRYDLQYPVARRFPFRVELRRFAACRAKDTSLSILSWICEDVDHLTCCSVNVVGLRRWLSIWPSLIILDGLDEVPPSSNRESVVQAIQDLSVDIADLGADSLLIVTTRPQGYDNDLPSKYYSNLYLMPLNRDEARGYAERLVQQRHETDLDRQEEILFRVDQALQAEQTSKLMQSPLQVTIMATLVERVGQPPQNRWRLFREYYDVIYRREIEREIAASAVLRDNQDVIDRLHYEVGFNLQMLSEEKGGTGAMMAREELEMLTKDLFSEDWEADELGKKVRSVMDAVVTRLVFLVPMEKEHVGFELRSLQEFMAAEHLTRGSDLHVEQRMRAVASAIHWRNVFRFAAGRILCEKSHQFPVVADLCQELNEDDEGTVDSTILSGSRLAVELLEDGILHQQPKKLRAFARTALRVLELPVEEVHLRVSDAYDSHAETVFQTEICGCIRSRRGVEASVPAWVVLLRLARRGEGWALKCARELWPQDPEEQTVLLGFLGGQGIGAGLVEFFSREPRSLRVLDLVRRTPVYRYAGYGNDGVSSGGISSPTENCWEWDVFEEICLRNSMLHEKGGVADFVRWELGDFESEFAEIGIIPIVNDLSKGIFDVGDAAAEDWKLIKRIAEFNESPGVVGLAEVIRVSVRTDASVYSVSGLCSWPLMAALWWAGAYLSRKEEVLQFADRVEAGCLGGVEEWRAAEERWRKKGIRIEDLEANLPEDAPFSGDIGCVGAPPFEACWPERTSGRKCSVADLAVLARVKCMKIRVWMFMKIRRASGEDGLDDVLDRWCDAARENVSIDVWSLLADMECSSDTSGWFDLLEDLGNRKRTMRLRPSDSAEGLERLARLIRGTPYRPGVAKFVANLLSHTSIRGFRRVGQGDPVFCVPLSWDFPKSSDDPDERGAVIILRLLGDKSMEQGWRTAREMSVLIDSASWAVFGVIRVCEFYLAEEDPEGYRVFLESLRSEIEDRMTLGQRRLLQRYYLRLAGRRPSRLQDEIFYKRVGLRLRTTGSDGL